METGSSRKAFTPSSRPPEWGDSVEVYTDESRTETLHTLHFLRQQMIKKDNTPNRSLADFIAPKEESCADYIGTFAVTAGPQVVEIANKYKEDNDDYNAIIVQSLGDRLAEAFAEYMHKQARDEWGFGKMEGLSPDEMVNEKYQGIRPAAGYPACPDHTEKLTIFHLLEATKHTGIELTESMAMTPPSSVSGLYFSHPKSRYFPLGRINKDQLADYAERKGWTKEKAEKWLSPNLGYNT